MRRDLSTWLGTLYATGRKAKHRRGNRPLKARGASSKISLSGGEPLDPRKMLAVTANTPFPGQVVIALDADNDVAGLVLNTSGTPQYEVYSGTNPTPVATFTASAIQTIEVVDTKGGGGGTGQVFEVRDNASTSGAIAAALGVSSGIETTKIFDDIDVTSLGKVSGNYGVVISSPTIILDDATIANRLLIQTNNTDVEFGGVVVLLGGTDAHIGSGTGAGDIDFLDDILGGGEDGSGTLTLAAGTGTLTFGGDIGGAGLGEDLGGVLISSAKSVTAAGKFDLDGTIATAYDSGLTIGDGVNNVNLPNGGYIAGFTNNGAAIYFEGDSTNSTIRGFLLGQSTYGIYAGGNATEADLSGTVIDGNVLGASDYGIYLDNVAGGLDGEDAFVIGGTTGNQIVQNGEDGIYAYSSVGVEITRNFLWINGVDGVDAGSGIRLEGGGEYLIAENSIGEDPIPPAFFGNSSDGITIDGEDGFYSYAGTVVEGNTIKYNKQYGVRVEGVTLDTGEDAILIFNNTISSNAYFPPPAPPPTGPVGGIRIDGSENIRIIGNVITFNGVGDKGNGIDIANGSHGTAVFSNKIGGNANDGVYVENSSILANPVRIGDVLSTTGSTGTTVTVGGDQRAFVVVGQIVYLVAQEPGASIFTATALDATVTGVDYDPVSNETTLEFESVEGSPSAVSLSNYIAFNAVLSLLGNGINVYATGEPGSGTVAGLEILGNVVVANGADGIRLVGAASDGEDLTQVLIQGNFVGFDSVARVPAGNGEDGIYLKNGSYVSILQNYVAHNGDPNPSNEDENGIAIVTSHHIDIGEDGLGNYIARNANDGVDIKSSRFINIVDNEIAFNGDDGIDIRAVVGVDTPRSQDILVEGNWIHDNGGSGIEIADADRVETVDNLIAGNAADGVNSLGSTGVTVAFNIIRDQGGDGVEFRGSTGTIEGNEIYANGDDGVYVYGGDAFNGLVDVLGNIIRENGDDGVEFRGGYFGYDLFDVDDDGRLFSVVGGNTIERNSDDGVTLVNVGGVQVGGRFPSDINFINLNGASGVCASGRQPIDTPWVSNGVWVLGNEIDSNEEYGVCLDGAEDIIVGGGPGYSDYDQYAGPEAANTIRRNGIAGVFAQGYSANAAVINNDISENPVGVMITSAYGYVGAFGGGLTVGGPSFPAFPGEDSLIGDLGNRIFDNGEGIRATGDCDGTLVAGNLIEGNLTGATLASVRGLTFGYGEDAPVRVPAPTGDFGNTVQNNNEGLRGSGDLTDTVVAGNQFIDNTKVGIALQSAKNLTVGGFGEDSPNVISGSPIGLSASGTMTGTEVIGNKFDANVTGISLSKATGMLVEGNDIANSLKAGISVTGDNKGSEILDNLITSTGDGPYAGNGIYLNSARNVDVIGNEVDGSTLAGLYATGNTSGTVVQGNLFTDNRIGMFLENASNAVFGGSGEDQGNTIVGGGDPFAGEYRDGILVVGTSTGSSITGTDIYDTDTGVWLRDAKGIEIVDTLVDGAKFFGLRANGDLTGSRVHDNLITGTTGIGGGLGDAIFLDSAQNLQVYDNIGEDSLGAGIYVTGDTTGTTVKNNLFDGNRDGMFLFNAINAAIGGLEENEGNTVVGGSDAANGVYRDGLKVIGTSTGSSIKGTDISDVTTGATLVDATNILVEGNTITGAEFLGVNASGTLTGSNFKNNTVTSSGGLGFLGHGIYLANASGLAITGNDVTNNLGNGLYVEGVTTGTTVYDNDFEGNRVGIYLLNTTNAVIGGDGSGEDNRIVGGGDASTGDFRDGIVAVGTLTGSSVTKTTITNAATGITLSAATGLTITNATVTGSQVWGLNANGLLTGTVVNTSTFSGTTGGAGGGAGVLLAAAQSLLIDEATIENNVVGLFANGDCAGSSVIDTTWSGNTTGVINSSTGVPALDITPLP